MQELRAEGATSAAADLAIAGGASLSSVRRLRARDARTPLAALLVVLLACLPLFACGSRERPLAVRDRESIAGWPRDSVAYSWSGFTVCVPRAAANDFVRLGRILQAVDATAIDFSEFTGRSIPPTWIGVVEAQTFTGFDGNNYYRGRWCVSEGFPDTIIVIEGEHQELPVLFHELVHRVFRISHVFPIDDPRWTSWNDESGRIAHLLEER